MQTWCEVGVQRVDEALKSGKNLAGEIQQLVNDRMMASGAEELAGALSRVVEVVSSARAAGWRFSGNARADKFLNRPAPDITRDLNRAFYSADVKAIGEFLGFLVGAVAVLQEKKLIRVEQRQQVRETDKAVGPIQVEVVALPPRVTKGHIERDEFGNIVKTTQVEMDA
jgi:hypothetical protein